MLEPWPRPLPRLDVAPVCKARPSRAVPWAMKKHLIVSVLAALVATLAAPSARAFCGFYVSGADATLTNDATLVVMMRDGTRTVLSMQNTYAGPPQDFAMVVPVPVVLHEANVKVLPRDIFAKVERLTAPRLVEYWEQDPCRPVVLYDSGAGRPRSARRERRRRGERRPARHHVKIEARFAVGEYDVVVLSAQDSSGLDAWLHENRYKIPDGAEPYLRPYVQMGMKFFVAKVNVAKVKFERVGNGPEHAVLSPLRFHYDADDFFLPVRLGLINSGGKQDLVTVILAREQRYEVAELRQRRRSRRTSRSRTRRGGSSGRSTPRSSIGASSAHPARGRDRVLVGRVVVRPLPHSAARGRGPRDARRGRPPGERPGRRLRRDAPARALRRRTRWATTCTSAPRRRSSGGREGMEQGARPTRRTTSRRGTSSATSGRARSPARTRASASGADRPTARRRCPSPALDLAFARATRTSRRS